MIRIKGCTVYSVDSLVLEQCQKAQLFRYIITRLFHYRQRAIHSTDLQPSEIKIAIKQKSVCACWITAE